MLHLSVPQLLNILTT